MSAETLREAAALMRERAKFATQGVWTHAGWGDVVTGYQRPDDDDPLSSYYSDGSVAAAEDPEGDDDQTSDNAEHIASWHPVVALAVADLLDRMAGRVEAIAETHTNAEFTENIAHLNLTGYAEAKSLARAYLNQPGG